MPSATKSLALGPGRRRRGCPESEDLPRAEAGPLAEGGFVFKRSLVVLAVALLAVAIAALAGAATPPKPAFPHRIVSLSPTSTESLFAIGAGPQVIAVDNQSDYPKSAPRTKLSG